MHPTVKMFTNKPVTTIHCEGRSQFRQIAIKECPHCMDCTPRHSALFDFCALSV